MSEKRINEELSAVEAALASLKPAASGVDRDRVMFLAGRASVLPNAPPRMRLKREWLWPCITAVSLLLAIVSSSALVLHRTGPQNISQKLWYENVRKETDETMYPRPNTRRDNMRMDYLSLNRLIVEKGVDALPGPLWIPIGPENIPRRDPMMQDEWKMF